MGLGQLQDMTLYNNLLNMIMRHSGRSRIIKKIGIRSEYERQDSIYVIWYWIGYLGDVVQPFFLFWLPMLFSLMLGIEI